MKGKTPLPDAIYDELEKELKPLVSFRKHINARFEQKQTELDQKQAELDKKHQQLDSKQQELEELNERLKELAVKNEEAAKESAMQTEKLESAELQLQQ